MPFEQITGVAGGVSLPSSEEINARYVPEPSTTGTGLFADVVKKATDFAGNLAGLQSGLSVGSFEQLIAEQLQVQLEMQQVSMISNIERSRHETKMTPLRNLRVS